MSTVTDEQVSRGLFGVGRQMVETWAPQIDAALALALLALSTVWLVLSPFAAVGTALVQAALLVPLVWRRSHPTAVFLVVCAVALAQWLLGYRLIADGSVLVALYTVAVHQPRRRALVAAAVAEGGAIMAAGRWEPAGTVPRSLLFLTATVVAALFAGFTVQSGSEYMDWLAERAERLEVERDQQKAIGAALERTRIAREIHDIVAHSLSVVITLADAAAMTNGSDPDRATEVMRQTSDVGRQALSDMRSVITVLRTDEAGAELGPQPDVAELGALFARVRAAGLEVEVEEVGDAFALGAATELSIYRILQEALTNTMTHAGARRATVRLHYDRPVVELTVTDDGRGGAATGRSGHGIEGMTERAGLHGGTLVAGPGRQGGWVVSAVLRPDTTVVPA